MHINDKLDEFLDGQILLPELEAAIDDWLALGGSGSELAVSLRAEYRDGRLPTQVFQALLTRIGESDEATRLASASTDDATRIASADPATADDDAALLRDAGGGSDEKTKVIAPPPEPTATNIVDGPFEPATSTSSNWEHPEDDEANISWLRELIEDMQEFSDGSRYLNFPGFQEEGDEMIRQAFGDKYARLVALKNKYDPTNFFSLNQNVKPNA